MVVWACVHGNFWVSVREVETIPHVVHVDKSLSPAHVAEALCSAFIVTGGRIFIPYKLPSRLTSPPPITRPPRATHPLSLCERSDYDEAVCSPGGSVIISPQPIIVFDDLDGL